MIEVPPVHGVRIDKQLVGETAARIRKLKKPEPPRASGIHLRGRDHPSQGRKGWCDALLDQGRGQFVARKRRHLRLRKKTSTARLSVPVWSSPVRTAMVAQVIDDGWSHPGVASRNRDRALVPRGNTSTRRLARSAHRIAERAKAAGGLRCRSTAVVTSTQVAARLPRPPVRTRAVNEPKERDHLMAAQQRDRNAIRAGATTTP